MDTGASSLQAERFPEESMIVKEIYFSEGGPLESIAVMYKSTSATNSSGGWIWNEMHPDGTVTYSAGRNGDGCVSCHSQAGSVDLVRTFSLH
jgi:hypothetical protein